MNRTFSEIVYKCRDECFRKTFRLKNSQLPDSVVGKGTNEYDFTHDKTLEFHGDCVIVTANTFSDLSGDEFQILNFLCEQLEKNKTAGCEILKAKYYPE